MNLPDYYLILNFKNNDRQANEFIFRTYYKELFYIAIKYLGNPDEAKDLVQSSFVKLWENREHLQEDKPLKPYLLTIHKNNCLDSIKRKKLNTQTLSETISATDKYSLEEQLISNELEYKIIESVSLLPPKCKTIFEMSRYEGLKNVEIAEKLNISIKTVENQMTIALEKLRKSLIDYLIISLLFITNFF
ncbi:MAG: RNA polymerase sigma-70 factor [Bacteroidota bacterium]|nr:RNA polymerase sigma-70 factor [Bacteroidota bacterium]